MSDKLEKFINEHRDEFDIYEPSPDLWWKIADRMDNPAIKHKDNWYYIFRIAAILIIVFVSFFIYEKIIVKQPVTKINKRDKEELTVEKAEMLSAEVYYNHQINLLLDELDKNYPEFQSVRKDVELDLAELDNACSELKKELGNNINNEEIIIKLIENYRLKLSILEEVLSQLRKAKKINELSKDNKNI